MPEATYGPLEAILVAPSRPLVPGLDADRLVPVTLSGTMSLRGSRKPQRREGNSPGMSDFQGKVNFIWSVADEILRDDSKRPEYRDTIVCQVPAFFWHRSYCMSV